MKNKTLVYLFFRNIRFLKMAEDSAETSNKSNKSFYSTEKVVKLI